MSAVVIDLPAPPRLQRARGISRVTFRRDPAGITRLADLHQDGCAKIRLPHVYDGKGPVAVLLNTAGGVTGGDHIRTDVRVEAGATARVTTQAGERIYRRLAGVGRLETHLHVGENASLAWLPQETILFDAAGLERTLDISLATGARFIGAETIILGRTAMGEDIHTATLQDHWRLRRDDRLVYADALRLMGNARDLLGGGATARGARAIASLLMVGPDLDARLDPLREIIAAHRETPEGWTEAGVSAFDGMLVGRLIASDGQTLRTLLVSLLEFLTEGPLPRVWSM